MKGQAATRRARKKYDKTEHGLAFRRNWQRLLRAGLPTTEKAREAALERGELTWETILKLTR